MDPKYLFEPLSGNILLNPFIAMQLNHRFRPLFKTKSILLSSALHKVSVSRSPRRLFMLTSFHVVLWNVRKIQNVPNRFAILEKISYYLEVVTISELQLNEILEHEIISNEVHTFSNLSLTPDKMYNKGNSKVTYCHRAYRRTLPRKIDDALVVSSLSMNFPSTNKTIQLVLLLSVCYSVKAVN